MSRGLESFLKKIAADPKNMTIIDRFISLLDGQPAEMKVKYFIKLSELISKTNPLKALEVGYLAIKNCRSLPKSLSFEYEALGHIYQSFKELGKLGKAELVVIEREKISKKLAALAEATGEEKPKGLFRNRSEAPVPSSRKAPPAIPKTPPEGIKANPPDSPGTIPIPSPRMTPPTNPRMTPPANPPTPQSSTSFMNEGELTDILSPPVVNEKKEKRDAKLRIHFPSFSGLPKKSKKKDREKVKEPPKSLRKSVKDSKHVISDAVEQKLGGNVLNKEKQARKSDFVEADTKPDNISKASEQRKGSEKSRGMFGRTKSSEDDTKTEIIPDIFAKGEADPKVNEQDQTVVVTSRDLKEENVNQKEQAPKDAQEELASFPPIVEDNINPHPQFTDSEGSKLSIEEEPPEFEIEDNPHAQVTPSEKLEFPALETINETAALDFNESEVVDQTLVKDFKQDTSSTVIQPVNIEATQLNFNPENYSSDSLQPGEATGVKADISSGFRTEHTSVAGGGNQGFFAPFWLELIQRMVQKGSLPLDQQLKSRMPKLDENRIGDMMLNLKKWRLTQDGDALFEIVTIVFKDRTLNDVRDTFKNFKLKDHSLEAWGDYLDGLIRREKGRIALYDINRRIDASSKLPWVELAYEKLFTIWDALGYRGFSWEREEGVRSFYDQLQKRPSLKASMILAVGRKIDKGHE